VDRYNRPWGSVVMGLSNKQKAVLHVAKSKLGLEDETYRDALQAYGGVSSSKDLDYPGFLSVMQHFARCGFASQFQSRSHKSGMASDKQIKKIYAMWWSLGSSYYRQGQERKALRGFLKKRFRVDHENFLTFKQAWGVIEAIKRIGG